MKVRYCIVGGGFAAAAAIEGIRAHDESGSVLLLSRENHRPYRRPLLTKDLWYGTATIERLPIHPDEWYVAQHVDVRLRHEVIEVDAETRRLWDERGEEIEYEDLLLATGCRPRRLRAEGAEISSVRYFRDLEDYFDLETRLERIQHVTIVGGGFTSVEMASALRGRGKEITMVLADEYPLHRVLPRELGVPLMMLVVNKVPSVFDRDSVKARVTDAYQCEVAAVVPHSDELMALASQGIFVLRYPDHPVVAELQHLVSRVVS